MKVLLVADVGTGRDGFYHVGDEAMLLETVRLYKKLRPKMQLGLLSRSISHKSLGVKELPHLPVPQEVAWHTPPKHCFVFLSKFMCYLLFHANLFNKTEFEFIQFIQSHDLIHFTGGGNLYSTHRPWLYYMFIIIFIGNLSGKKVILSSQSLGPFQPFDWIASRFFLNLCSLITIREPKDTFRVTARGIVLPKLHPCLDAAYVQSDNDNVIQDRSITIGISLHSWDTNKKEINSSIAMALNMLAKKWHLNVVLIPHIVTKQKKTWDLGYMTPILQKLRRNIHTTIYFPKKLHRSTIAEKVRRLTASCDLVIASRYHALVFALSSDVPAITFHLDPYYNQKNSGILRMVYGRNWRRFIVDDARLGTHVELEQKLQEFMKHIKKEKSLLKSKNDRLLKNHSYYSFDNLVCDYL